MCGVGRCADQIFQYHLVASQAVISPDGYTTLGMVINGMYPRITPVTSITPLRSGTDLSTQDSILARLLRLTGATLFVSRVLGHMCVRWHIGLQPDSGITVDSKFTNDNGTAIHWHGVRQFQANWQDGVPGVTQCPIKVRCRSVLRRLFESERLKLCSRVTLKSTNSRPASMELPGIMDISVCNVGEPSPTLLGKPSMY